MHLFPNPFKYSDKFPNDLGSLKFTVDSGESALRIALKSFSLPANAKIAIPAYSCNSVYQSVVKEGFIPVYFDLKPGNTYWADYDSERLLKENIKVLIFTHLYGFIHPDTIVLNEFCKKNEIKIIHDAAQSFGVDESFFGNDIIVYSFSSGKSSTAAAGGEICNLSKQEIGLRKPNAVQNLSARLFFNTRYVDYQFPKLNAKLIALLNKFGSDEVNFFEMSDFQKTKALQAKYIAKHFGSERKERYDILKQSLSANTKLKITYDDIKGLYFKMVIFVPDKVDDFIEYLKQNSIIYYRLAKDINAVERRIESLPLFSKNYFNFVEISTERSIDLNEIKRIAGLLAAYK